MGEALTDPADPVAEWLADDAGQIKRAADARRAAGARDGGEAAFAIAVDAQAGHAAAESDELVAADLKAELADAGAVRVVEADFEDDDLDANLREDDVELVDETLDEPDVVGRAEHHDRVAALVAGDGHQGTEFVGTGCEHVAEVGIARGAGRRNHRLDWLDWRSGRRQRRGRHTRPHGAGVLLLERLRLGVDDSAEDVDDVLGLGVLEIEDVGARVRFGLLVEPLDQIGEEIPLARVGHDHDLLRAVVGAVGRGLAELVLQCALQNGAELVHELAGLHVVDR